MGSYERNRARTMLIAGFSFLALGTIVTLVRLASSGYFSAGPASSDFELVLSAVVGPVQVWAWWWLSQLSVEGNDQRSFMRKAFYGLCVQSMLYAVIALAVLSQVPVFNHDFWSVAQLWASLLGNAATFVGFLMMAREFPRSVAVEADDESVI